ncbi:FGGY family carbohydrate kinase [Aquimarina sp. ERC-38]|uniref:xylulokinase n=1 Tax=Aquimarina sp. ERC-38 TaxID=2949996 RepID=UPI002246C81B|nr:FGGY family carbohydrate kinase [Aquimarina sp. ERC-38]UZO80033.1 FGGY family carbohydrate kinase [Aquimarina sp. ERC-38]
MYIGIDLGSSSIKVSLITSDGKALKTVQEPEEEMNILVPGKNWAEQNPETWWSYTCSAIARVCDEAQIATKEIKGIGIAYQMHGLVLIEKNGDVLRNAIIWCDSRAVAIGDQAFQDIGEEVCMNEMLNSPANFTASKLKWLQVNEPEVYQQIHKIMLPGDFIAYKLSGKAQTTTSGLSEGVFWNFKEDKVSKILLDHYNIKKELLPEIVPTFGKQSEVSAKGEEATGIQKGTPILYRAGDQPNNAFSLNVLNPGEVAVTGGTSGVLYAVTESMVSTEGVKLNNFAHVNHDPQHPRIGKLLCINGCGIQYRWLKEQLGFKEDAYEQMNQLASSVPIGADGVVCIPFGNGAERMLNNKIVGTHYLNLNLPVHNKSHLCRATLEGIAFTFVYGMELLKKDNSAINLIRAGSDNLFRSQIFAETIATLTGQEIEVYNTTGAIGAARAAGLTLGTIKSMKDLVLKEDYVKTYKPLTTKKEYQKAYTRWRKALDIYNTSHNE